MNRCDPTDRNFLLPGIGYHGVLAALTSALLFGSIGFVIAGSLMAAGVWLHLTERHSHLHIQEAIEHEHAHVHDEHHQHAHAEPVAPGVRHTHKHNHEPVTHSHVHYPDAHHQHRH